MKAKGTESKYWLIVLLSMVIALLYLWNNKVYKEVEVTITALNEANELSMGKDISILKVLVDEKEYSANQIFETWNSNEYDESVWNGDLNNDSITGIVPSGEKRIIVFSANPWKGKVKIEIDKMTKQIDLYSNNGDGIYNYAVLGDTEVSLQVIIKTCCTFFKSLFILTLIFLFGSKILN